MRKILEEEVEVNRLSTTTVLSSCVFAQSIVVCADRQSDSWQRDLLLRHTKVSLCPKKVTCNVCNNM